MIKTATVIALLLLASHLVSCRGSADPGGAAGSGDQESAGDQGSSGDQGNAGGAAGAADGGSEDGPGGAAGAAGAAETEPHALFNGVDFTNWDRYLGKPSAAEEPLGLNNDPRGVYSVVQKDGEPALRISGEVWGSLISQAELCNFDLRVEYQWGTAVWPPLSSMDSGIMFLSTGPLGAVNAGGNALSDPIGSGAFMVSMEYQVAPGDVGSLYNLGPIGFATASHTPGSELANAWNRVEIMHQNGTATSWLNGQQVSQVTGFQVDWPGVPEADLRCGKLQLQSEGAEIFFRRVVIQELP